MRRLRPWEKPFSLRLWQRGRAEGVRLGSRQYATVADLANCPKPGDQLHGFTVKGTKHVPELELTALHLQHDKTKAEHLHISRDDRNNVFSIGFKTNPPNRTGVPHILEHTTLCGSEKYPVRDPFFKMLPRSLSNFMNAFTSSDHTTYPFATTNRKDFGNLMSVYLDSTLNPLLKESDFAQEGWRVGPQDPLAAKENTYLLEENQKLVFKGVVYNEMKGQMSDASYLYYIRFQEYLYPDLNNSGGDPLEMTKLKHQELKDFHKANYHPSNAKILTYGDIPVEEHLPALDEQLSQFLGREARMKIKSPISLREGPLYHTVKGPVDPLTEPSAQFRTSTSWLMNECSDIVQTFSLSIVSSLLLDGYGSPMYQALVETGLGSDFSPNTGYDSSFQKGIFSVGLNGVKQEQLPMVKKAIQSKLEEVSQKGFDKGKVDGLLHQLELSLKHKTANFGMGLVQRLEPGWFNGIHPFNSLAWNDTVEEFKKRLAEPRYLEGLVDKYLLNDRTLTFTMEPSETYADDLRAEESLQLLAEIEEARMRSANGSKVYDDFARSELDLLDKQTKANEQDLSCLPTLRVEDISRFPEKKETRDSSIGDVNVQWREASTNGLTYFRAINNLNKLPADLRMLLPLFSASIMRLGTKDKTVEELEDIIKLKTGGIGVSYHASPSPGNMYISTEGISLSGYALDGNVTAMYELLRTIIQDTDFDGPHAESQIRQLLQQDASGALDSVAGAGHSYASRYAQAGISVQGTLTEETGGLTQVQYMASLADRSPHQGLGDIITKLKAIQSFVVSNSGTLRAAITCGVEASSANESALTKFLSSFPASTSIPNPEVRARLEGHQPSTFFPLPYQVFYSALSLPTKPFVSPLGAPLQILSQLLTHKYLHHEIREKGGAYGGGASARDLSGIFNFYSYRDPNPQNTLKIMQNAGVWARDRDWTARDLEEAKLSTFQNLDAPQSVSEEGMVRFLSGVTSDMEQRKREELLDVTKEDVQKVAHLFLVKGMKKARTVVLGPKLDWATQEAGWSTKKIELGKPSEFAGASDLSSGNLSPT